MKIEHRVPMMTPRIMAKTKLRMVSPPRMKMQMSTSSVDTEVMMVRPRVELIDLLMVTPKSCLG